MKKYSKPKPTILGRCSMFTSYYCPPEIFSLAFKIIGYDKRKEEIQEACKKLSVNNQVRTTMNHEFSAYNMLEFGFSMGYVMGQLFNVKDRKHLPVLTNLFKKQISENILARKKTERKGLPYIDNLEKKAA
jgi:hypothetical protein